MKRAKRNRDGELRWANSMWSDALNNLHRYRQTWKSARHRAAMYLQSNENFSASLHSNHAAYLQLVARAEQTESARDEAIVRAEYAEAAIERVRAWADEDLRYNDRVDLLYVLDQPQQPTTTNCVHPEGYEDECPCPPSCICCQPTSE
ncbi:hypothetical protein [Streptomyces sp. BE133]|uniref:hypothetical protein n=1 Tax=Streptomyces sp. BE133 TaxID=3002523 RepID=UPI002E787AD4|nr:hypothetical protein [Streptomyces sp. BE133]MEE1812625.1 hypothetical protein [Streptomyces sp. BE133]